MLTYDGKLHYDGTIITKADSIISLEMVEDVACFGILTLSNEITKVIQFIRQGDSYKARLILLEEDIPYINDNILYLNLIDNSLVKKTDKIKLIFDSPTVQLNVKRKISKEIQELTMKIKDLENQISNLTKNHRLMGLKLPDLSYIKKGMIPVAADDKGNFIAAYPFEDSINKINGLDSVSREILITAKDIPFDETRSIADVMIALGLAINQVNLSVETLATLQQDLLAKLTEVELKLDEHLGTPII